MRLTWGIIFIFFFWGSTALADPLTLKDCLELAFKTHPSLKAAKARVLSAKEYERASYKEYFPTLDFQYVYTRYRDHQKVVIMGYDVPLSSYEEASGRFFIVFPIFHGLALRVQHKLKELDVSLSQVEEERTQKELAYHVKEAYFSLLKAERRLKEAQKSVERLRAHLEVARGFYEQGLIARNDLLQSEVALAQGEHALVVAQNAVELARSRLNLLLDRPLTYQTTVVDTLDQRPTLEKFESYLSRALNHRAEIKAALLALRKARENVRLAKSQFYPWLDLQGVYEKTGTDLALTQNPYRDRENAWVALTLNWRLFDWGKRSNLVSGARAQALVQEASLKEIKDRISLEVRAAFLRFTEAQNRLVVAEKSLDQAQENFTLNEARYQEQLASSTDVLDAETLLTSARINYVNALVDLHLAQALLEYVVGEEIKFPLQGENEQK